ncbi:MAG TPA: TIGR00282 family metallophosphoesterase [Peptococcaceae bacterium]|nr:TIGR00282 family metallophosphoesterase [Peptococcaceae bacterium]
MKILFLGDVVGRPGRRILKDALPRLVRSLEPDMVIANGENAAAGNGLTEETAREIYSAGVDVITMGNHTWDKKEIFDFIDTDPHLIRPANYPPGTPGKGWTIYESRAGKPRIAVINLMGRVFLNAIECPFRMADILVEEARKQTPIIIVDFHAEATSEKIAMGWHLDGRVSAVVGTHTHVQTADERILPLGTAYITDAGMTGPRDSILGIKPDIIVRKFLTQMPARFEVAEGIAQINGVLIQTDDQTGLATEICKINQLSI